ncbi:MAG: triose-phosphate isomerase [candidate division WOR-3 bacterium]
MNRARPLIAGNWKMNLGPRAATTLACELLQALPSEGSAEVAVFPPFTSIPAVAEVFAGSHIVWGGQNLHWEDSGAFTGEVAPGFLAELGCRFVLVGHSERRQLFGEQDDGCGRKVAAAIRNGLRPILCCGETLNERETGRTLAVIERQLDAGLPESGELEIAYEPVWAIGTGRAATPEQVAEVHARIRDWLRRKRPALASARILYGGSVKPDNAASLLDGPDVNGFLVGGASLDAGSFSRIVGYAG